MLSRAAQHRVKIESGLNPSPDSKPVDRAVNNQYRAALHQLKADIRRLSEIRNEQHRNAVKRGVIEQYRDYLEGVLIAGTSNRSGQDTVLVWCALWSVDVGDISGALRLGSYAIQHGMTAPQGFNRSLLETLIEDVSRFVLAHDPTAYRAELQTLWELSQGADMPTGIIAKLCKAYGLALADTDPDTAIDVLTQAQTLKPTIGVKGHLKKLQKGKPVAITATAAKRYELTTTKAAKMAGVSVPTFLKLAALNPMELPYICFQSGKNKAFRFCEADVKTFLKKHTHSGVAK